MTWIHYRANTLSPVVCKFFELVVLGTWLLVHFSLDSITVLAAVNQVYCFVDRGTVNYIASLDKKRLIE